MLARNRDIPSVLGSPQALESVLLTTNIEAASNSIYEEKRKVSTNNRGTDSK